MTLRDFCVSRSCRVVLRHARLWISNGHPTSEVYKYQQLTVGQARISTVRQASNQGVRGSNPIGRTFDPIIVTHVLEKMGENTRLTGHNDVVLMVADPGRMPSASPCPLTIASTNRLTAGLTSSAVRRTRSTSTLREVDLLHKGLRRSWATQCFAKYRGK